MIRCILQGICVWFVIALVVVLGSEALAFEDTHEDIIIIWGEEDQVLIPLGDGFYMDTSPAPKPEYTEEVLPDFYTYPGRGYPTY